MGAWGFNILDDDTARDVHAHYMKQFNAGRGRAEIVRSMEGSWRDTVDDPDEGPVFWIAIAKAQWDCGQLDRNVLFKVREIIERGEGLARWEDEGPKALAKRKEKLSKFLHALRQTNLHPRRPKKPTKRKPVFNAGDCLAVRLSDGDWGAVLVLTEERESEDPADETYGQNIVAQLRYKSKERPTLDVFERREWLRLTHHGYGRLAEDGQFGEMQVLRVMRPRFSRFKDRFEVVGSVAIRESDPKECLRFSQWDFAEDAVVQEDWDRGVRSSG